MKSKTIKITILLTSICLVIIFINCKPKKMETFEWDATSCAPEMYPIEMYKATFVFENGYAMDIPGSAFLQNGWGKEGGTVGGNNFKPLPTELEITWISYTENKFYTGNFPMPTDTMAKLFKEGFTEYLSKTHGTYNVINVGMAPGGIVVVWLMGVGKVIEIGRYQAKDTVVSMHDFAPTAITDDQSEWCKIMLEGENEINDSIKKNGVPYGLWDTYREKFNWRPIVDFEDKENGIADEILVTYFNGEVDEISEGKLTTNPFGYKARIIEIDLSWSNKRKIKEAEIKLDKEEIFKAYKFIYQDNPDQKGQFRILINKDDSYIRIYLENTDPENHREIQLYKADIKIYPSNELNRGYFTVFKDEFKEEKK